MHKNKQAELVSKIKLCLLVFCAWFNVLTNRKLDNQQQIPTQQQTFIRTCISALKTSTLGTPVTITTGLCPKLKLALSRNSFFRASTLSRIKGWTTCFPGTSWSSRRGYSPEISMTVHWSIISHMIDLAYLRISAPLISLETAVRWTFAIWPSTEGELSMLIRLHPLLEAVLNFYMSWCKSWI